MLAVGGNNPMTQPMKRKMKKVKKQYGEILFLTKDISAVQLILPYQFEVHTRTAALPYSGLTLIITPIKHPSKRKKSHQLQKEATSTIIKSMRYEE